MKFENVVLLYLQQHPCEDAFSAKKCLMALYAIMDDLAQRPEQPENWYKVQQLQTWSPLRFFWDTLVDNESLVIRAAAKGNICESTGQYGDDREVATMAARNAEVLQKILQSPEPDKDHADIRTYVGLPEAEEFWVKAGFGRFAPTVTYTVKEL